MMRWTMMRTWLLFLALASVASAECIDDGRHGAHDSRTNTDKGAYQQCHWETVYNNALQRLWDHLNVGVISAVLANPVAGDDGIPLPWIARVDTTLTLVACRTEGTCTTKPTYALKTDTGGSIGLGATLTCTTGSTPATWVTITSGGSIAQGHTVLFDTTNTPSGDCTYAVLSVVGAETLP